MKTRQQNLPSGKLPPELLARLFSAAPILDQRLLVGPGVGLDCAVVDIGTTLLVFKSDPITFTTDEIGWYAVQVNANDIACSGAQPRWLLVTLLLPDGSTDSQLVEQISQQVYLACRQIGVSVIGGHSEITSAVTRPVIAGTLIGEVAHHDLVTPRGVQPGDRLLLTKWVPIEAVSILARDFPGQLKGKLSEGEIDTARDYLYRPGISVLRDAQIATKAGRVNAMHDPTEGGLAAALWELATACGHNLVIDPNQVYIPPLAERVCAVFDLDPMAAIASGTLLLSAEPDQVPDIQHALQKEGIPCFEIGFVEPGSAQVWMAVDGNIKSLPYPERDEIARLFESD